MGRLNKHIRFLGKLEELDGTAEAIKRINSSDYLAIVIIYQVVIVRGEVSVSEL